MSTTTENKVRQDVWIFRATVIVLGSVALLTALFGVIVSCVFSDDHSGSEHFSSSLISIGATALGALAGLIAPSPHDANAK